MGAHAPFSPSALSRLMACPGSWRHNLGRESKTSPYAAEGTLAHHLAENALRLYISLGVSDLGKIKFAEEFPEEMHDYIQEYVDHVVRTCDNYDIDVEKRVKIIDGDEPMWGTVDAGFINEDGTAYIVDLKYGMGIGVEAVDNPQLAAYAIGFLKELYHHGAKVTKLVMQIFQPRVDYPLKEWVIDDPKAFYDVWMAKLKHTVYECKEDWYFETGDHCRFCPGKLECPEMTKQVEDAIVKGVEGGTDLTVVDTSTLLKFQNKAKAVQMFLKAVESELTDRATRGENVRGWKLVQGLGNRAWNLPEEEMVKKLKNQKLKKDEIYNMKLCTPTQLQKKLKKEFMEQYVERPDIGLKFVPESDKREAVQLKSSFGALEESDDGMDDLFS